MRRAVAVGSAALLVVTPAVADPGHPSVSGAVVRRVAITGLGDRAASPRDVAWDELALPKAAGRYAVRFSARGEAVFVPHCNGREHILVDGHAPVPTSVLRVDGAPGELVAKERGPIVVRLEDDAPHEITLEIAASTYEKRLACTEPPRIGAVVRSTDGVSTVRFPSPYASKGGGEAVVFVPGGHDRTKPSALLVGTHPWNGSPWTYAAYEELVSEAGKRDVILLMPSGLGNSLYVADAEAEVLLAIDAVQKELAIDPQRVSIWGASMGGAGATTISFHHPDRFAFVASWFGDSQYDLTTYVRGVLGGEAGAHRVNALDVLENARHLPVFLVHGEEDRSSPMKQSTLLYDAMRRAKLGSVELERVRGMGHEGPLVVKFVRRMVAEAALARAPLRPSRVSFRSVRPSDTDAYGVHLVRTRTVGDALVDLERQGDAILVHAAEGVRRIDLAADALGTRPDEPRPRIELGPSVEAVPVRWLP